MLARIKGIIGRNTPRQAGVSSDVLLPSICGMWLSRASPASGGSCVPVESLRNQQRPNKLSLKR